MKPSLLGIFAASSLGAALCAANPIVQTVYTADPAPVVRDGVLYLFVSHDEDQLEKNFFTMRDWRCYSTVDMANWTDHGAVASLRNFTWAGAGWGGGFENGAWAPQAIERDGRWYLYVPLHGRGIGVLVADSPFGPYADPLGRPLIAGNHIDPSVFIDDDGQAYLTWGNPTCWYARLNRDMISYDPNIGDKGLVACEMSPAAFGVRSKPDEKRPSSYEEGPWLYKRDSRYYLFFAGGPIAEHLAYSTSEKPTGPWRYGGVVMPAQGKSFTNHPGVVDYKGKTYLFYHNGERPGGGGFHRSVCVDELTFSPDGSVEKRDMSQEGPAAVATLDPYRRVEAETLAWAQGVETRPVGDKAGNSALHDLDEGDYIRIRNVDFGPNPPGLFTASVSRDKGGNAAIEVRLDRTDGPLIATLDLSAVPENWETVSTATEAAGGVHDVFFVFRGESDAVQLDWWKFERKAPPPAPEPPREPVSPASGDARDMPPPSTPAGRRWQSK